MPQNGGQAPLGNVSFVTVSFSDTRRIVHIQTFGDWLVGSGYWLAVGKDYGVGAGTHQHVQLDDPTPDTIIDHDFASYVDEKIASGALPPDLAERVRVLSVERDDDDGRRRRGWMAQPQPRRVTITRSFFPVARRIPAAILDSYTFVASHELIEAATDPTPLSGYDFGFGEGEVADLCDGPTTQDGYSLPTIWSNTAAGAGRRSLRPGLGLSVRRRRSRRPPQVSIPSQRGCVGLRDADGLVDRSGGRLAGAGRRRGQGRVVAHRDAGSERDGPAQQRRERPADRDDRRLGGHGEHGDRRGDLVRAVGRERARRGCSSSR